METVTREAPRDVVTIHAIVTRSVAGALRYEVVKASENLGAGDRLCLVVARGSDARLTITSDVVRRESRICTLPEMH